MYGDRNLTVTYTMQQNLKIGTKIYGTLQSALNEVTSDQVIQARDILLPNAGIAVYSRAGTKAVIKGGYNETFTSLTSGLSIFSGTLKIEAGTLIVDGLAIK